MKKSVCRPKLAGHGPLHCQVEVSRLKDDERSVAPQLQTHPLDCSGTLTVQYLSNLKLNLSDKSRFSILGENTGVMREIFF